MHGIHILTFSAWRSHQLLHALSDWSQVFAHNSTHRASSVAQPVVELCQLAAALGQPQLGILARIESLEPHVWTKADLGGTGDVFSEQRHTWLLLLEPKKSGTTCQKCSGCLCQQLVCVPGSGCWHFQSLLETHAER